MRPPGGSSSRYAALRHEVARATTMLPRKQLHIRRGLPPPPLAAAGSLRRLASKGAGGPLAADLPPNQDVVI